MQEIVSVAVGAVLSLAGVVFGSWFTARRQDRMWLREQKLKAAVEFNTAAGQLYERLRGPSRGDGRDSEESSQDEGPGYGELAGRLQDGRSALYLLCDSDTVDLADQLARRVFRTVPTEGAEEHAETLDLLRRFTRRLRREIHA